MVLGLFYEPASRRTIWPVLSMVSFCQATFSNDGLALVPLSLLLKKWRQTVLIVDITMNISELFLIKLVPQSPNESAHPFKSMICMWYIYIKATVPVTQPFASQHRPPRYTTDEHLVPVRRSDFHTKLADLGASTLLDDASDTIFHHCIWSW